MNATQDNQTWLPSSSHVTSTSPPTTTTWGWTSSTEQKSIPSTGTLLDAIGLDIDVLVIIAVGVFLALVIVVVLTCICCCQKCCHFLQGPSNNQHKEQTSKQIVGKFTSAKIRNRKSASSSLVKVSPSAEHLGYSLRSPANKVSLYPGYNRGGNRFIAHTAANNAKCHGEYLFNRSTDPCDCQWHEIECNDEGDIPKRSTKKKHMKSVYVNKNFGRPKTNVIGVIPKTHLTQNQDGSVNVKPFKRVFIPD